jgi:hypothetical protein
MPTTVDGDSVFEATFPDGHIVTDWSSYDQLSTALADTTGGNVDANVELYSEVNSPGPRPQRLVDQALEFKGSIGTYFYRLSAEPGTIGGCINQVNVPHLGFLLKDRITDRQIVNLHLASWIESGRRCFGVYNSATGWCKKICAPNRRQMQGLLAEALVAVGVSSVIATILSQVMTPFVGAALLL